MALFPGCGTRRGNRTVNGGVDARTKKGAGSIPGYSPDRCRCRNRNRNLGLGRSGVSITTTTTAALTTTTKIAGQADTYSGVILNQPEKSLPSGIWKALVAVFSEEDCA